MAIVSDQQHRILDAVRRSPCGAAGRRDIHAALFGPRERRGGAALSPSQRASLSRALRRLVSRGLLTRTEARTYVIPAQRQDGACG